MALLTVALGLVLLQPLALVLALELALALVVLVRWMCST
jgi:hypothetical protein